MINKIINEWTYQLDSGYPTKDSDYEILRTVLREMNMLSEQEINQTIYQAKGLHEQPDQLDQQEFSIEELTDKLSEIKLPQSINSMIQYIYEKQLLE